MGHPFYRQAPGSDSTDEVFVELIEDQGVGVSQGLSDADVLFLKAR